MMEPRPLPNLPLDTPAVPEPRLELLPEIEEDEDTPEEAEPVDEAEEDADEASARPRVAQVETTQDPLKLYVRAIGDGPLLTHGEERELARRKDAGDEEEKNKLNEAHGRLVMSITRNNTKAGVPLLALIQDGNLGRIRAIGKFDYKSGSTLST